MPAVRTPEASRPTRRIAVPRCSLPRRGIGSAASITFDFAALPCGSGLSLRSLALQPATFLSTLRSGCYQTVNRLPSLTPDRRAKLTPERVVGARYLGLAASGSADPGIVSDGGAEVRVGISGQARSRRRRAHAVRGFTGKPHANRIIARCNPG